MDASPWSLPFEPTPAPASARESATFGETLRDMLRLAIWRAPSHPAARLSGLAISAYFGAIVGASLLVQFFVAGGKFGSFTPYGLNGLIAGIALEAIVILTFTHFDKTRATTRNLVLVYGLAALVSCLEEAAVHVVAPNYPRGAAATPTFTVLAILAPLLYVWLIGAARQAFKTSSLVRRPTLRAIAFFVALIFVGICVPQWPAFVPANFNQSSANLWEWSQALANAKSSQDVAAERSEQREAEARAARREEGQDALLSASLDKLERSDPVKASVFTLGVAGFGQQDVFLKEIRQSTDILKAHFHGGERTLNLINNDATASEAPLANMQNLGAALRGIAGRMDKEKDLFVLVLSSHGSPDGFALNYGDFVDRMLDPKTLRASLDAAGIKNRVLIVSSCYSGAFVAPLQSPDTVIVTAAAADRTSFGCADDRSWTWFGEAFFEKALAEKATLAEAFALAKTTIADWERRDKITASNPQIFIGEAVARRFPDIVGGAMEATLGAAAPATKTE